MEIKRFLIFSREKKSIRKIQTMQGKKQTISLQYNIIPFSKLNILKRET